MWLTLLWLAAPSAMPAQVSRPEVAAQNPVTWLIFVDDLHLDFRHTGRIRNTIRTIIAELMGQGDQVAMASSGPSGLQIEATSNRDVLADAIRKVTGHALKYEDMRRPSGSAEALYRAAVAVESAHVMFATASRTAAARTALVYVSNGLDLETMADSTQPLPSGRRQFTRAEIVEQLARLTATATQSGMPIFAIKPRGASFDLLPGPSVPAWEAHLLARETFLQSLSDRTGGLAIVDGDLVTELRRVSSVARQ